MNTFLVVEQNRLINEFGVMKPRRNIKCAPNPKTLSFLKLLHAYLQQSKSELNYIEAKRANEKLAELAEHEF